MKILQVTRFALAGMPWRINESVKELGVESKLATERDIKLGIPMGESWSLLDQLIDEADLVHVHHIQTFLALARKIIGHKKKVLVTVHGAPDTNYVRANYPAPSGVPLTVVNPALLRFWPRAEYIPNFVIEKSFESTPDIPFSEKIDSLLVPPLNSGKTPQKIPSIAGLFKARVDVGSRTSNEALLQVMNRYKYVWDNLNNNPGVLCFEAARLGCTPIVFPDEQCMTSIDAFFGTKFPRHPKKDLVESVRYVKSSCEEEFNEAWKAWFLATDWMKPAKRYKELYEEILS